MKVAAKVRASAADTSRAKSSAADVGAAPPDRAETGLTDDVVRRMSKTNWLLKAYDLAPIGEATAREIASLVSPRSLVLALLTFAAFAKAVAAVGVQAVIALLLRRTADPPTGAGTYNGPPPAGFAIAVAINGVVIRVPARAGSVSTTRVVTPDLAAQLGLKAVPYTTAMMAEGGPTGSGSGSCSRGRPQTSKEAVPSGTVPLRRGKSALGEYGIDRSLLLLDRAEVAKLTAVEDIELNALAMNRAGIPNEVIVVLKAEASRHARSLGVLGGQS